MTATTDYPEVVERVWAEVVRQYHRHIRAGGTFRTFPRGIVAVCQALIEEPQAAIRRRLHTAVESAEDAPPPCAAADPTASVQGVMPRMLPEQPLCPGGCGTRLAKGRPVMFVPIGPGSDTRARSTWAQGVPFRSVRIPVCGPCATGAELVAVRELERGGDSA